MVAAPAIVTLLNAVAPTLPLNVMSPAPELPVIVPFPVIAPNVAAAPLVIVNAPPEPNVIVLVLNVVPLVVFEIFNAPFTVPTPLNVSAPPLPIVPVSDAVTE